MSAVLREHHERNIEAATRRILGSMPAGSCQLTFYRDDEMQSTGEIASVRSAYLQGRHWLVSRRVTSFRIEGPGVGDFNISENNIDHTHSRECIHCGEVYSYARSIMRPEVVRSDMDRHMRRSHAPVSERVSKWIALSFLVVVVVGFLLLRLGVL